MHDDPTNDLAEASRIPVRRVVTVGAGWLWVLITGVLWSLEPWQRPWITRMPDERVWFALSCAGLVVLTVLPWRWKSPARYLWKSVLVLASGALLFVGLPVFCKALAVESLESMLEKEIALHAKQLSMGLGGMAVQPDTLVKKLHDALENIGVGSPKWLKERARNTERKPARPTHGFIAASSWPVRKRMADAMVRDALHADYLMAFWKEYFPAFTGQDVTLECRRDWLSQLDALRKEPGLSLPTRQASLLMMALIILTDPPEFESWRAPVRDAMIQLREPLLHRWTGHSQTFWYRSLDALLALDPPGSWARHTRPMVVEGAAFKQAVEAPVRGLFGNFDAFLPIFENCKDLDDLFLFWQSAGGCLKDHPESFDAETAEQIRTWRRDTLFRWLLALGDGSQNDLTLRRAPALHLLEHYPITPYSDTQQKQLLSAAEAWIQKAANGNEDAFFKNLHHIQYIHPYLEERHANALCEALVPILFQPETFEGKLKRIPFNEAWADCLWFCQSHMTDQQQRLLRDQLAPLMARLAMRASSDSTILYIDAWSTYPALSRDLWLAMAWAKGRVWRTRPKDTSHFTRPSDNRMILTVPELSEDDIESFARLMEFSLQPQAGKSPQEILAESLHIQVDKRTTTRPSFIKPIRQRMSQLGIHSGVDPAWLRRELKAELADLGLYRIHGEIADSLMDRARSGKLSRSACLHFPEVSDVFWAGILKSPEWAEHAVIDALDGAYKDQILSSLILAIERSSPEDEVIRAVWDALKARSYEGENRQEVFGALFRLSPRVSEEARQAMRREYLEENPGWRIALHANDLGYRSTVAYYVSISRASPNYPEGYDPNALAHPGGGIGIPWDDDALSARTSWKTALDRQLYSEPMVETSSHRRELFAYVAHGADLDNQIPRWNQPYRHPPLTAPFPPTPWQKARALHGKRPDLEFR
jgi:hypothetical protein